MRKWFADTDEFYVGYVARAPEGIASIIRKVIFILIIGMICIGSMVAWHQKKFSLANFEYGIRTGLEGYIFSEPVPHLLIPMGKDLSGTDLYQTVLLVGFGKARADEFIRAPGKTAKVQEGSNVRLNGSLIYGDGKTLLQIDEESHIESLGDVRRQTSKSEWEKNLTLSGEIVDPKCYFGVMKPGEGKAHRSCAIRCIAGGIPPVFSSDSIGYYLLINENNEPVSMEIANIVGDHITIEGDGMRWNDWTILRIDSKMIYKLSVAKRSKETLIAFEEGITQCK